MFATREGVDANLSRDPDNGQRVGIGSRIRLIDHYGQVEFVIVSDVAAGRSDRRLISAESRLAQALIGRQVGDQVKVHTPTGTHVLRILDIS
jgi:transcription elongation GreA/GreB family factor